MTGLVSLSSSKRMTVKSAFSRTISRPLVRALALVSGLGLAACDTVPLEDTPTRAQTPGLSLEPMKSFGTTRVQPPQRSNGNIAADFLALHFQLESGRDLPVFTRFETPITVRVTGSPPASLQPDLTRLLGRLRGEAGIDIRQVSDASANITIEAVSREEIGRALPHAACFVVPNVSSLAEFRRDRRKDKTNWANLRKRERLGIFVPYDSSPQELRDCLHEELAQAIGPLNDLYRLPDSVFNDDNIHTILTGFDMLVLRATYAPELRSGMSQAQVAAVLPDLLGRLNPRGVTVAAQPVVSTPRAWIDQVQAALGPGTAYQARLDAANRAAQMAQSWGWVDQRRAFGHYMLGRMLQTADPDLAQRHFLTAMQVLQSTPGTRLHQAYVTTQTAAFTISRGDGAGALAQLRPMRDVAAQAENAALLATLMMLEAEALTLLGKTDAARDLRLDSVGWARYGFGSDWAVRAKMQEIAALNPRNALGG
ncbi:DUF2927 domain-containing protein [Ruegeria pomeroyi]|nr:DUF2927 domain-containing protein [Ruegeria pomeroyi]